MCTVCQSFIKAALPEQMTLSIPDKHTAPCIIQASAKGFVGKHISISSVIRQSFSLPKQFKKSRSIL